MAQLALVRGGADTGGSAGSRPLVSVGTTEAGDPLLQLLGKALCIRPRATIVEVGCGSGELCAWLARTAPSVTVTGVDANLAMLRRAGEHAAQASLTHVSFVFGTAYELPLLDNSADLVICKNLLCAIKDAPRAVAQMARVVKPGGLLVAIEPASAHGFHDPDDGEFTRLSERLNDAFHRGWLRRGVDQHIGIKVPALFLAQGLEDIRVDAVTRVHAMCDSRRSWMDLREQFQSEAYRLPDATIELVISGGLPLRRIEEHHTRARQRLERYLDDPAGAARSGYTRITPAAVVTIGRKRSS